MRLAWTKLDVKHVLPLLLVASPSAWAANLPAGFVETQIATPNSPVQMDFAPDGRLFICEKGGTLRIVKNDKLLAKPFLTVTTDTQGERGLLGVAVDPDFANNKFVSIYFAAGENKNSANSQSLNTTLGKILRINKDGSIPTDNPFFTQTSGKNRAIWALGLRNPYTFAFDPQNGRMFINDVGESTTEEINDGIAGSNYGWPTC